MRSAGLVGLLAVALRRRRLRALVLVGGLMLPGWAWSRDGEAHRLAVAGPNLGGGSAATEVGNDGDGPDEARTKTDPKDPPIPPLRGPEWGTNPQPPTQGELAALLLAPEPPCSDTASTAWLLRASDWWAWACGVALVLLVLLARQRRAVVSAEDPS